MDTFLDLYWQDSLTIMSGYLFIPYPLQPHKPGIPSKFHVLPCKQNNNTDRQVKCNCCLDSYYNPFT